MIPKLEEWSRQPLYRERPNPRFGPFGLLWSGAVPQYDSVQGPATINGTFVPSFIDKGRSPSFNGSNVDYRWARSAVGSDPVEATLFALVQSNNVDSDRTVLSLSSSGSSTPLFRFLQNSGATGWEFQLRGATTLIDLTAGVAINSLQTYALVGVYRNGTRQKELWVNGVMVASSATNVGTIALDQSEIGVLVRTSPALWWSGFIAVAGVVQRAWSQGEVAAFSANPFRVFAPRRARVFVNSVAAGASAELNAAGSSTGAFTGQAATSGDLNAAASSAATFGGQSSNTAVLNAAGTSTGTLVGATGATGVLNAAGTATASFVGDASTAGSAAFDMHGTSLASFGGQSTASAALDSEGSATARFVGEDASEEQVIYGGRVHARRPINRAKLDDEEILRMLPEIIAMIETQPRSSHTIRLDLH